MCGIGGWIGERKSWDAREMVDALKHRGPDGHGIWTSNEACLVHTRLAILDLSTKATQPMTFPAAPSTTNSNAHVLAFNGEIYNFRKLREELKGSGEVFQSDSDTEVLLRLLVREGSACLPKLHGMFAFAYWDGLNKRALLARDPFGIKPLYYRNLNSTLEFASEVKALRKGNEKIDADTVRDFLLWGTSPEPGTLFQSIRQLPAGHLLRWENGKVNIEPWNKLEFQTHHSDEKPERIARKALQESVARHLVSDVPVGFFLSGGIDSTALLALAREHLGPTADIRTFSIGFSNPEFDESSAARQTAEHFGALHTEWQMTSNDARLEIPEFLAASDQPTIDGFNTWCVSKLARKHGVKVVISGLGGDELAAGYNSFRRVPNLMRAHRALGYSRPLAANLLKRLPLGSPWQRLASFFEAPEPSWLHAFHAQRGIFTPSEAVQLTESICDIKTEPPDFDWNAPVMNPRDTVSFLELTRYMRNQLLRDSDIFSMAHGLELRVPLVDQHLFSKLSKIPTESRLRDGKQLILDAVPEIPSWVRNRPKKGFRFPFQSWMESNFGDLLERTEHISTTIPLTAWYRKWAVAILLQNIDHQPITSHSSDVD